MIIIFVNNIPANGKSTACLCLANAINELPGNDDTEMIVFDCDPSFPSYKKYEESTKNYKNPLNNFQMNRLDLSNQEMVNLTVHSIKDKHGFYLFDIPAMAEIDTYLRLLVSSHLIMIPIQPSRKDDPKVMEYLTYIVNLHFIIQKKTKGSGLRIMLIPIHINDKDAEFSLNPNPALPIKATSPILYFENLSDNIIPLKTDNISYACYQDYLKDILQLTKHISQQIENRNLN